MPINVAASVITTFSLYCGIASIFAAIRSDYEMASYWILAAIISDMLDGTIARLTKSVSDFGKELDGLADMVSFGVAPAVLIYTAYLIESAVTGSDVAPMGSMVAIVFVICTALRLARYNIYQAERQDLFVGLPSPAAAGTIASFTLFVQYFDLHVAYWVLGPLTVALALLMVSTVRYPKRTMRIFVLSPRYAVRFLVLCGVGIAVFHYARQYHSAIVLLPLGMAYVLFGVVNGVYVFLRRKRLGAAAEQSEETRRETLSDLK
ncbi:MAG: CDP-diacylglycerol--serine O-phosphatidyltransferase [Candidatus Hydrogenedentes bacterium]|nr:CDP-diacylglycerol--serine O-phosphatidyltransferase [Candidatus Hydrogenedentota bacterium]